MIGTFPLISVIVASYNIEHYLPKCIESLIGQTYSEWEMILVDDSSDDGSLAVCRKYSEKDSRIRVFCQTHGGVSKARNFGIKMAKGDYIAFVDGDDYVAKDYLKKLYFALADHHASLSICGLQCVNEDGEYLAPRYKNDEVPVKVSISEAVCSLGSNVVFCVVWNKLYKREIFDSVQFTEGRIFEDELILHHLYGICDSIATVPEKLYYYTIRKSSKMREAFGTEKLDVLFAYMDRLDYLIANGFSDEIIAFNHGILMLYFKYSYLHGKRSREYRNKLGQLHSAYVADIYHRLPPTLNSPLLRLFTRTPFFACCLMTVKNKLRIHHNAQTD